MLGLGLGIGLGQNVAALSGGGGGAWTPASLPGLALWIEADATKLYTDAGTTLVTSDGDAVAQANDKSGLGHHLSQGTLAQRPLYRTGAGKPYLEFDGSNDRLITGVGAVDGTGQHYIALSCYLTSIAVQQFLIMMCNGAFADVSWVRCLAGGQSALASFNTSVAATEDTGASFVATTPVVLIGTVTTTAAETFMDNASGASTALTGTRQTGTIRLDLCADINGVNCMGGRIYGVVQGSGTLSSGDRSSLQTYLAGLHP